MFTPALAVNNVTRRKCPNTCLKHAMTRISALLGFAFAKYGNDHLLLFPTTVPRDQQQEGLHRLVLYFIAQCDKLVNRGYVVVYAHSFMSWFDRSKFSFLYNLYQVLPRKYKKNLQQLFVLHGGITMKVFFEFARMFIRFVLVIKFLSCMQREGTREKK